MIASLALAALALVKPLPDPRDVRAGTVATGCILYYRLETTAPPGGSAACEAQGYGLEFMRAHWLEVEQVEAKRKAEREVHLQRGREIAALLPHRNELEGACFAMVLDGGAPPDGGARVCELLGITHDMVTRTMRHRTHLAEQAAADAARARMVWMVGVFGALAVLATVGVLIARRRSRG